MSKRNYRKEAAQEAVSFLYENYRVVIFCENYTTDTDYYKMKHTRNGNTITILADTQGYTIKKNSVIVKREP